MPQYQYEIKVINTSNLSDVEEALNSWGKRGWRVAGVIPRENWSDIILEREVVPHSLSRPLTPDPGNRQ